MGSKVCLTDQKGVLEAFCVGSNSTLQEKKRKKERKIKLCFSNLMGHSHVIYLCRFRNPVHRQLILLPLLSMIKVVTSGVIWSLSSVT